MCDVGGTRSMNVRRPMAAEFVSPTTHLSPNVASDFAVLPDIRTFLVLRKYYKYSKENFLFNRDYNGHCSSLLIVPGFSEGSPTLPYCPVSVGGGREPIDGRVGQ